MLDVLVRSGCATSEDMLWKLEALSKFIDDLHWPDPELAAHMDSRLRTMSADMIQLAAQEYSPSIPPPSPLSYLSFPSKPLAFSILLLSSISLCLNE